MLEPMRYAALFGALGAVLATLAAHSTAEGATAAAWLVAGAEGYAAICLLTMAIGYALNHWGIPLDGAFERLGWTWAIDVLLFPYAVLARLTLGLLRRCDSMEPFHPVGERLYVGRLPFREEHSRLSEVGVTSVLNLCAEFPRLSGLKSRPGLETAFVPILDGSAPSPRQFQAAVDWTSARHFEGHSVLVHCAQGRGRSVTIAAAALCRLGLAADSDEALAAIRAARPKANPSRIQRVALSRFLSADQAASTPSTPRA
jgi:hypothetical protein